MAGRASPGRTRSESERVVEDLLPNAAGKVAVVSGGIDRVDQVAEAVFRPFPQDRPASPVEVVERVALSADRVAPKLRAPARRRVEVPFLELEDRPGNELRV